MDFAGLQITVSAVLHFLLHWMFFFTMVNVIMYRAEMPWTLQAENLPIEKITTVMGY